MKLIRTTEFILDDKKIKEEIGLFTGIENVTKEHIENFLMDITEKEVMHYSTGWSCEDKLVD